MQSDDDEWDDVTTMMPKRDTAEGPTERPAIKHEIVDEGTVEIADDLIELIEEDAEPAAPKAPVRGQRRPTLPFQKAVVVEEESWDTQTELLSAQTQAHLDKQPALPFRQSTSGSVPAFDPPPDEWSDQTKPLGNVFVPPRSAGASNESTKIIPAPHPPAQRKNPLPFVKTIHDPPTEPFPLAPSAVFRPPQIKQPIKQDSGPLAIPTSSTSSSSSKPASVGSSPSISTGPALGAVPELAPIPNLDTIRLVHDPNLQVALVPWVIDGIRHMRTVVVKWSGDIVPGLACTMRPRAEVLHGNVFRDGDASKSLVAASDFAPQKTLVDVTLVGHAHASGGVAEASLVGFHFGKRDAGGFERKLMVFGERRFERVMDVGTGPGKPLLFRQVPLIWELALGGEGSKENPVGRGRDRKLVPQIEDPERLVHRPQDAIAPVCFAPVSPNWAVRWTKTLGTGQTPSGVVNLASDFDWSAYQVAPKAQRIPSARGDESFTMSGMHPERPIITGQLPGMIARCFVVRQGKIDEVESRLDTIAFDMDALRVDLVCRGMFEVLTERATDVEAVFVMLEKCAGARASMSDVSIRYQLLNKENEQADTSNRPGTVAIVETNQRVAVALSTEDRDAAWNTPRALEARRMVQAKLAAHETLAGLVLEGANLSGLNLAGQTLVRTNLRGASLRGANLEGADLTDVQAADAVFSEIRGACAKFDRANLSGAQFESAALAGASFVAADLTKVRATGAIFRHVQGEGARFSEGSFSQANFDAAQLVNVDFTGAQLDDCSFVLADLTGARFYDARGARVTLDEAKLLQVHAEGVHFAQASLLRADARGSVWDGAVMPEAKFGQANLQGASLQRVEIEKGNFAGADMAKANLRSARLVRSSFEMANLTSASLESADLTGAILQGTNLYGAKTWKAQLNRRDLARAVVPKDK